MNIGLVSEKLARLSDSRSYLIAYSGGIDSHVLLHALVTLRDQQSDIQLRTMHIHHGLSLHADDWLLHCERVCKALNVPFLSEKITVSDFNKSVEAAAREARYRVLETHLRGDECLLTAHTQDDQAETVLLQLMRGAGPKGLSAMPLKKPFVHSVHLRPLLNVAREAIEVYATQHQLQWVEDDSNTDICFDRNYLRHQVMPLLKARWPAAVKNVSRSAGHCARAADVLANVAQDDLFKLQGTQPSTLSISALMQFDRSRRANALRYWLREAGCRAPSTQQLEQIECDVLQCDVDAMPVFDLETGRLRRYRDDLYYVELLDFDSDLEIYWNCQSMLKLPGILGELHPDHFSDFTQLTVRFRHGGESIKPAGSTYTQSLKKLFQQWGVPPWERDRIPLVFDGDTLIAVYGYCHA